MRNMQISEGEQNVQVFAEKAHGRLRLVRGLQAPGQAEKVMTDFGIFQVEWDHDNSVFVVTEQLSGTVKTFDDIPGVTEYIGEELKNVEEQA